MTAPQNTINCLTIFKVFLKLGLTSFGGPIAHLEYFRQEFVERRKWMGEHAYADLVALCQFLPGPASSQVGIGIGLSQAGIKGACAAWLGFTLPSAIMLVFFAIGMHSLAGAENGGWIHGLKIAAVAVVAQAVWNMARTLAPDIERAVIAIVGAIIVLFLSTAWGQVAALIIGGVCGYFLLKGRARPPPAGITVPLNKVFGWACLLLFFVLLVGLPILAATSSNHSLALFDVFYRAGSLVFGGGHVVLPLLQAGVVPAGWVTNDEFLAGYGAAQAVPGPLFTFAAYLGAIMQPEPRGWPGAALCLAGIFLPSFLLVCGVLPFWESLRRLKSIQSCLLGINAAVVGILLAALYDPVWLAGITSGIDLAIGLLAFALLIIMKSPPWLVVGLCACAGFIFL